MASAGSRPLRGRCRHDDPLEGCAHDDGDGGDSPSGVGTPVEAPSFEVVLCSLIAERGDIMLEEMRARLRSGMPHAHVWTPLWVQAEPLNRCCA